MTGTRLLSTLALLALAAPTAFAQTTTTAPTVVAPAPTGNAVAVPPGSTVVVPPGSTVIAPTTMAGSGTSAPGSQFGVTSDCAGVSGATTGGMRGTTTSLDCRRIGTAR